MRIAAIFPIALSLVGCSGEKLGLPSSLSLTKSSDATPAAVPVRASNNSEAERFSCKGQSKTQARAERLVVTITTRFSTVSATEFGAGVVFSVRGSTAYILTAAHVVQKTGAGKPSITVSMQNASGRAENYPAQIVTKFTAPTRYRDVAVLQAEITSQDGVDLSILRDAGGPPDLKDVIAIGNPNGGGKTMTPPGDADLRDQSEIHLNSGVMAPGYSGGGMFDAGRRLIGLVFEDAGQYAAAYPIEPILYQVKASGIPVDLRIDPKASAARNVFLSNVDAPNADLKNVGRAVIGEALSGAGFEPYCPTSNAYRLSVIMKVSTTSGTSSLVEFQPTFLAPNGAPLSLETEQTILSYFIGFSPMSSPDALEGKLRQAGQNLANKVIEKIGKA